MDETTSVVAHAEFPKHTAPTRSIFRPPRRAARTPSPVRRPHRPSLRRGAPDLRGRGPLGARRAFAALGADRETYDRENPKRVYYLSMEFLIGRSLANNIINLLLDRYVEARGARGQPRLARLLEQEPDAGLGNGGLGRLAACFLDSMATMQLPAMGYGLRYEYGMFRQAIENGWQREHPDNWLRHRIPGRWRAPAKSSRSSSAARSRCSGGKPASWSPAGPRR